MDCTARNSARSLISGMSEAIEIDTRQKRRSNKMETLLLSNQIEQDSRTRLGLEVSKLEVASQTATMLRAIRRGKHSLIKSQTAKLRPKNNDHSLNFDGDEPITGH